MVINETVWRMMNTAPKRIEKNVRIDIVAKYWDAETDTFEYKRFTDCYWDTGDGGWIGLEEGWHALAWTFPQPFDPVAWADRNRPSISAEPFLKKDVLDLDRMHCAECGATGVRPGDICPRIKCPLGLAKPVLFKPTSGDA